MSHKLELSRKFNATPQRVYAAWTKPEHMLQWFAPGPMTTPVAEVDLRVGGQYRVVMERDTGEQFDVRGVYHEVTEGARLVFTWQWVRENSKAMLISLGFEPDGEGTRLTLLHEAFPSEESCQEHAHGWEGCLGSLGQYLSR